jgi:hypothetical protein
MDSYQVYNRYVALRNHFNVESYDFFKYNGKSSVREDTFRRRKDKFFFEKLAKHRDPEGFMIANFSVNPKTWIKDLAYSSSAEEIYVKWLKRKESLSYIIQNDLSKLEPDFDKNFIVVDGQLPPILKAFLAGKIYIETVCVLANLVSVFVYWDKSLKEDYIWKECGKTFKKYTPFIVVDNSKIKKIIVDFYKD